MTLSSPLFKCTNCKAALEVTSATKGTALLSCPNCSRGISDGKRGQVPIVHLLNALMRDVRGLQYLVDNAPKDFSEPLTLEDVKLELISLLEAKEVDYDYYD